VVVEGNAVPPSSISHSLNDSIGFGVGGGGSVPDAGAARGYSVHASVAATMLPPPRLVRQRSCFDSLQVCGAPACRRSHSPPAPSPPISLMHPSLRVHTTSCLCASWSSPRSWPAAWWPLP
jgi:hypothetical protein